MARKNRSVGRGGRWWCPLTFIGHLVLVILMILMTMISAARMVGQDGDGEPEVQMLLHDNYYTMHQDQTHVTLEINVDGQIEWDQGNPTLYSVFREQVVRSTSGERMYTLEATATRYWICMNGKGRLYTKHQKQYYRVQRKRLEMSRIRHETNKKSTRRWNSPVARGENRTRILPPGDCLFKTYEFHPEESYERSVGIYSYVHSNLTHGRFLSISPETGQVRSYRKPFSNLYRHHHVKISQVPVRYLKDMVSVTRFGRGVEYNGRVRQCILHLIRCPNHQEKITRRRTTRQPAEDNAQEFNIPSRSRHNHHFYKIIQRCKRRAERTDKPPKCVRKSGGGDKVGSRSSSNKRRLVRRRSRRRRRKS